MTNKTGNGSEAQRVAWAKGRQAFTLQRRETLRAARAILHPPAGPDTIVNVGALTKLHGTCSCGEREELLYGEREDVPFLCCECREKRVERIIATRDGRTPESKPTMTCPVYGMRLTWKHPCYSVASGE